MYQTLYNEKLLRIFRNLLNVHEYRPELHWLRIIHCLVLNVQSTILAI